MSRKLDRPASPPPEWRRLPPGGDPIRHAPGCRGAVVLERTRRTEHGDYVHWCPGCHRDAFTLTPMTRRTR